MKKKKVQTNIFGAIDKSSYPKVSQSICGHQAQCSGAKSAEDHHPQLAWTTHLSSTTHLSQW